MHSKLFLTTNTLKSNSQLYFFNAETISTIFSSGSGFTRAVILNPFFYNSFQLSDQSIHQTVKKLIFAFAKTTY